MSWPSLEGDAMEWFAQIVVGLLALLGTLAGSYMANRKSSALMLYRLDQVERKVESLDKSQELASLRERVTALEAKVE